MKKIKVGIAAIYFLIFFLPHVSAAHFIVGIANDALDGTTANGRTVIIWKPSIGISDNLTDIVGTAGNSGSDNIYLLDCELLNNGCNIGDEINIQIMNNGSKYISETKSLTITGSGFDTMENMTLNSPPQLFSISVDDILTVPNGEIDLTPATETSITCSGIIVDLDGESTISNITSEFFDNTASFYLDSEDNNKHYTNTSCFINTTYGTNTEAQFICGFSIEYYSNPGDWNCTVQAYDNLSIENIKSNNTLINTLLALSVPSPIDFGISDALNFTQETNINITNVGNSRFNLSLSGYASEIDDGLFMNCTSGKNISIEHAKYNLTESNPQNMSSEEIENSYLNLTSDPVIRSFNLDFRKNDTDLYVDDTNYTYWRIYTPKGLSGNCSGNIIFGAIHS